MISELKCLTNLPLVSCRNLFEPMQNMADFLNLSGTFRILAQTLVRIGNDLRLLSSGPGTGINEISLPEMQPGSSIMPGKVNPSIIEMLTMVCYQIIGYDQAIFLSSISGQLELNVMLPLIAYDLLEQIKLLTKAIAVFEKKCLSGITANRQMCQWWFEKGVGLGAILNPIIGYEKAATLVKEALTTHQSIKNLAIKKGYLTKKQEALFSPKNLTRPNIRNEK
jgi:aspartate ammonia-lyase